MVIFNYGNYAKSWSQTILQGTSFQTILSSIPLTLLTMSMTEIVMSISLNLNHPSNVIEY